MSLTGVQSGPHPATPILRALVTARHRVAPHEAWRPRPACDTYEPRRPDPFTAPPGAVPFPTYLEALNDAAALRRALEHRAAMSAATRSPPAPARDADTGARPDAARIGDVPAPPADAPEPAPHIHRVVTAREVGTGRIFDAVF